MNHVARRTARTVTRSRAAVRSAALGVAVIALAAGCGAGGTAEDGDDSSDQTQQTEQAQESGASDTGGSEDSTDTGASDGGGSDDATSDSGGSDDASGQSSAAGGEALPRDADLAAQELPVPAEEAIQIAKEATGGGDLTHIEIDHDDDVWEWELEIILDGRQHDIDVDATTGEVTEHDQDDDDDQDPVVDVTSPMPYSEAIQIAVGEAPGRVSGWELDSDDGRIRYQIEIDRAEGGDDVEVEIDVETGETRIDD